MVGKEQVPGSCGSTIETYIRTGTILPRRPGSSRPAGKGEKQVTDVRNNCGIEPLPRQMMPDASAPAYDEIMAQIQDYHHCCIGISYYYIWAAKNEVALCRIVPGGGKIFFHEVVDHEKHGICDEEIEEAVHRDTNLFPVPGYYPISPRIENKLRVLFEHQAV